MNACDNFIDVMNGAVLHLMEPDSVYDQILRDVPSSLAALGYVSSSWRAPSRYISEVLTTEYC